MRVLFYLLFLLFCCSFVFAFSSSSASYNLVSNFEFGAVNSSSVNFELSGVLGQFVVGSASSSNFELIHGILGPASFIVSKVSVGAGGGGAGCAKGFYKDNNGDCVELEVEVGVISEVSKRISENYLFWMFFPFIIILLVFMYWVYKFDEEEEDESVTTINR